MRYWIAAFGFLVFACASPVRPDAQSLDVLDAAVDISIPDVDTSDAIDVTSRDTPLCDPQQGCQPPDSGFADIYVPCLGEAGAMPLPGLGQSCSMDGGVNPEYCRESQFCGKVFQFGEAGAFEYNGYQILPYYACDYRRAVVRSGFIDRYEVTVGRFRQWVEAGMPRPRVGETFFPGAVWQPVYDAMASPPFTSNVYEVGTDGGTIQGCTWTPVAGTNENRAMNCVSPAAAIAFCWWDGKHVATEIAWEYIARNRGLTDAPFGAVPVGSGECRYGDVGRVDGVCTPAVLPEVVGSHRNGDTFDPPGVHDLFGGLREFVISVNAERGHDCVWGYPYQPFVEEWGAFEMTRGNSWHELPPDSDALMWAASRGWWETGQTCTGVDSGVDPGCVRSPRIGIRCSRFEDEAR